MRGSKLRTRGKGEKVHRVPALCRDRTGHFTHMVSGISILILPGDGTSHIDLGVREPNSEQSVELPKVIPSKPELKFLQVPSPSKLVQGWGWGRLLRGNKAVCVGMGPSSWEGKVY